MNWVALMVAFLKALPELFKLLSVLQKLAEDAEADWRVKSDVKEIHQAIIAKDADKLNRIFRQGINANPRIDPSSSIDGNGDSSIK